MWNVSFICQREWTLDITKLQCAKQNVQSCVAFITPVWRHAHNRHTQVLVLRKKIFKRQAWSRPSTVQTLRGATASPAGIVTHRTLTRVSQKLLFWPCRLASKHKMTCHTRNTLSKDGGSSLSFGPPPGPQKVSDPYSKVENSKLSYEGHHMLIRRLFTRKTEPKQKYLDKYRRKTKWPLLSSVFLCIFQKYCK